MSLSFACECGQQYQAPARFAGRSMKCRVCGRKVRVPEPAGRPPSEEIYVPTADEIIDDEPFALADIEPSEYAAPPIPRRIDAQTPASARNDDSGPRWRTLVDALPRWDDLKLAGGGLILILVLLRLARAVGAILIVTLLALGIAAPVFLIWGAIIAVQAAAKQKSGAGPILLASGIIALSVLEAILVLIPPQIRPVTVIFGAIILAMTACLLLWARKPRLYRQPMARSILGALLFACFAGLTGMIVEKVNQMGLGDLQPPAELAATADGGQPAIQSLLEVRRGFQSRPVARPTDPPEPIASPPPNLFRVVQFPSAVGPLAAYLTPDPGDGSKRPAIVWITGGDCNTIGDVWNSGDPNNDQTAAAYREAGMVMMFPSLRGGNTNPGRREGFLGEVDDVLAAAEYLASQPYVDPERIYLGGHSTGGTLVMLVAESAGPTPRFRAVFSFGPVHNPIGYGPDSEYLPYDTSNSRENELRSPIKWLPLIRCPTYAIEGTNEPSNWSVIAVMKAASKNPMVHFLPVRGATHFSILGPANRVIAARIMAEARGGPPLSIGEGELDSQFGR